VLPTVAGRPLLAALCLLVLAGCSRESVDEDLYVARVGDALLTQAQVRTALSAMPAGIDSAMARDQIIEQWVSSHLLAAEARRRGLLEDEDVMRQLEDNERNVLGAALLERIYDEEAASFSRAEMEAFFDRNRDRIRLREPYVRVRYIDAATAEDAEAARQAFRQFAALADDASRDSVFAIAVRNFARDTTASLALGRTYVPQSRLARQLPGSPWAVVTQMGAGEISPVLIAADSTYLVVQLVDRVPAGAEPRLEWVADDLRRQMAIQTRKQTVAREVQRLRTEAEARGELHRPERHP
jgi:hypothetical protein